jgi:hypothetical protein
MIKQTLFIGCIISAIGFSSCNNRVTPIGSKKINLTDASAVVTETDTTYLGNIVEDITQTNSSAKQIANDVIQIVDSVKEASAIAATETNDVSGTNIECKDFSVTLGVLMNQDGGAYTIADINKLSNVKIQTNGIIDPSIEQIYFTKLKATISGVDYVLDDLHEFKNKAILLPKTDNVFISDAGTLSFANTTNKSIILATDRAMRKAGISRAELQAMQKTLANTNNYTDAPCKVYATAVHYKISGTKNGKKVAETIKVKLQ